MASHFKDAVTDYQKDRFSTIRHFQKTGTGCDVTLVCDGREFKCHKLMLTAASEYFQVMFYGQFAERGLDKVPIHGVDSCTLEQLVQFMYTGDASFVNDGNVFEVLTASDMFLLAPLRTHCIRYLTERRVPITDAMKVYTFACTTQETALLSAAKECILAHIDQLSRSSEFAEMSSGELVDVISSARPSSTRILSAIRRWVSANCTSPEVESILVELVRGRYGCDVDVVSSRAASARTDDKELSLVRVLANRAVESEVESELLTPRLDGESDEWYPCRVSRPIIADDMRSCVFNDHIYMACSKKRSKRISFEARPSNDLAACVPLAAPLAAHEYNLPRARRGKLPFSMCSDGKSQVYMSHGYDRCSAKLDVYSCSADSWSPLSIHATEVEASTLTWQDGRLVLLDHKDECGLDHRNVRAYDPRVGTLAELADYYSLVGTFLPEECCVHKGRVYMASTNAPGYGFRIDAYDPLVNRWEAIASQPKDVSLRTCRMLSCDDKLWLFRFDTRKSVVNLQWYDSYVNEWSDHSTALQAALHGPDSSHMVGVVQFDE